MKYTKRCFRFYSKKEAAEAVKEQKKIAYLPMLSGIRKKKKQRTHKPYNIPVDVIYSSLLFH